MKRTLTLIACVAICCAMMVSCRNSKTTGQNPNKIQQQKQALADTVLAEIDVLAEQLCDASSKAFKFQNMELTEEEKYAKPDYLLAPKVADMMITSAQKISALAIYCIDQAVRKLYEMPLEEVNEAIVKLAVDVNFPLDMDYVTSDAPLSEIIKATYDACRVCGDQALFWQFEYACTVEIGYLMTKNPDLYFDKISEEQWQGYYSRVKTKLKSIEKLSRHDEEMANLWKLHQQTIVSSSDAQRDMANQSIASAKQYHIDNKDKFIAKRNALLQ